MSEPVPLATPAGPAVLRRSDRATLAISVLPDGTLDLVAPRDSRESDIVAKVGKRLRWIVHQRTAFADMNRNRLPLIFASGATHRYLGRQYRLKVRQNSPVGVKLTGGYFFVSAKSNRPEEISALLNTWYRAKAIEQLSARLAKWEKWCATRKLPTPRARLLRMPKRWGSAHHNGQISFNPDLVKAPSVCVDYVIAHEICHLKHPRHDKAFYDLLSQIEPNWRAIKQRLERQL